MSAPTLQSAFIAFLQRGSNAGGFGTDDVLAAVLPLFEQVASAHQGQRVAPLDGISSLLVTGGALGIDPSTLHPPRKNPARIAELQQSVASALDVVGESLRTTDLDDGTLDQHDLQIGEPGAELTRPVYLLGYVAWEHRAGHHDPLTDVFSLGLILASCACSLDLNDTEDLERFVRHRGNLFALNPHLHPVLASMIAQTTDLNRHRRIQTVDQVIQRLRRYRDQTADFSVDFTRLKGYRDSNPTERGKIILTHLRNRLFEISRRNRLVYFKPTLQTLNLTLASVPLMLDHRNIKPTQLLLWHDAIARALTKGESIVLGQYVRFEDAAYASGVLDQIIAGERRDRQEYGFAQLRLVICFLRWHNLKESPEERIHSPLLLLPVELTRKKGVRDAYVLKPLSSEAEVNPALRHHLRQLYGLTLPESIDLGETTLEAFHALLADQIRASEPGVTLALQNRPQIELIHERARQRLDQFRRRQRLSPRGSARLGTFDYSYDRDRFRPLGLQLFQARVKPARSPFSSTLGTPPTARPAFAVASEPPAGEGTQGSLKEQPVFALQEPQDGGNPYHWDYDVCSQTLGNFNYRKMSLVQDYAALLEKDLPGSAFDSLFTEKPRTREGAPPPLPLRDQYPVVDCDPTQMSAVARARTGQSYIIQGPPGTGKSQTITNLIADYVARGKRVLFVCEKRAAIDVVFHRLGRQGLDDLCCLIHDSQTDKREFIRNLKQTYEGFLAQPLDETLDARRDACARQMEAELAALQRWSTALEARVAESSVTVRELLGRLVELRSSRVSLDPLKEEWVPSYAAWSPHAEVIRALCAGLKRISGKASLADHSFRHLSADALTRPQPLTAITAAADEGEKLLATIASAMESLDESLSAPTLGEIEAMVALATTLAPAAAADALDLLNPRAARTRAISKAVRDWRTAEAQLEKSRQSTRGWRAKLSPQDTHTAMEQAQRLEGSLLRWLHPAAWRLRAVLRERYDFSLHAVPPSWSQILRELAAEQAAGDTVERNRAALVEALGDLDLEEGLRLIEELPARLEGLPSAAKALHAYLQENPEGTFVVEGLAALRTTLTRLRETLHLVLVDATDLTRGELGRELKQLRADLVWLPDVLPLLSEALRLPAELQSALRQLPLNDAQLEAAVALRSLHGIYQNDRALEASDGQVLAQRVARLQAAHREWLTLNARWIHQQVRRTFLRNVQRSTTPASQLSPEEKELKRRTATGRRELEHEFSKTMRHRSIRDLADDETGAVLRDLKPVWLMSPLSVSDTLPLAVDAFDVAIYDEASQILVEEAVPAVYRARQVIVVGDEMQLPPTNFFSATRSGESSLVDSDDAEDAADDLDADSFLTQSARTLPSTLLGWHYRSRYESLISYSNHAFYEARLLTVPDRQRPGAVQPELVAGSPFDPVVHTDALLARAISFHFHPEAVYERRSNTAEAESIALLVRELLSRKIGMSLGVVAFSEAQQGEIESALTRLGTEDPAFRNRLEEEYEREENGQFCGLFVKNLENVQGDERDIILLSVCYGYDRSRRMLMNFGPINQRGGEKRLNVIFSRARQHMAVISSIHHFDITNDYNDGANCLRNFLDYAAACSRGDTSTARRVLQASHPTGPIHATSEKDSGVIQQLEVALRERGFWVDRDVGQSTFRLPLALRRRPEDPHLLGILLDDSAHYAQRDLLERFLLRPSLLESFGWNVVQVFTKDWFHDPEAVLRQIDRALEGRAPVEVDPSPALPEAPPESRSLSVPSEPRHTALSQPIQPPTAVANTPGLEPRAPEAPRHFTCTEEGTSKFWEVRVFDGQLTVRFGRLGTKGQTQTKAFSTAEAAGREREKLIRSKLAKGYTETNPPPSQQTGDQTE